MWEGIVILHNFCNTFGMSDVWVAAAEDGAIQEVDRASFMKPVIRADFNEKHHMSWDYIL